MQKDEMILVVDDDPQLCQAVSKVLQSVGYGVQTAVNGVEALDWLQKRPFSLILADIEMPHLNGYQLLQQVRQNAAWYDVPLIFLSGRKLDSDIRFGKQLGADDYLLKPLNIPDLVACVEGKLLRFRTRTPLDPGPEPKLPAIIHPLSPSPCQQIGALRINEAQHRVWLHDEPIALSAREFALLARLAQVGDQVVSLQELVQATHNLQVDAQEAGGLIRPLIRTLRRRLGYSTGETSCIENVRGVGYRLLPPT